ncbi:MAG: glycosyltransferase [Candidatus Thermoplasmatota archaeon]|nr:glycosyltransferase [Candidatus Thermoplasmatota archaeon]
MSPKNLLVITNSFPDEKDQTIGSIFVKEQLRYVCSRFDQVHVFSPSMFGIGHRPKALFKDYTYGNVHVHFLNYFNIPFGLRFMREVFVKLMAKAISNEVDRIGVRFDLVHAHFTWPSGRVAVELKRRYKFPVVITEHTSLTFARAIAKKDKQFVKAWTGCDRIVRNVSSDVGEFQKVGIPPEKVAYIPNGFDSSKFRSLDKVECRRKLNLPEDMRILLSVGMLDEVKGFHHLVDAMADVHRARDDVMCVIVGGGMLQGALETQILRHGLTDFVKLAGRKPYGEMPLWMNACDMLAHSSLSESGPMVMFEAMACGRPYVGTRVGSVPDVVTSDDYGLVCAPGDPSALSGIILKALDVDWSAEKIIAHARKFDWSETVKPLLSIYDELLVRTT